MNELLFFATIAISLTGVIAFYRFWGKMGLFAWIAFASIIANIETIKCVDMFGMSVTLGTILYSSNFLCTDILHQIYGGKESRIAVRVGFFSLIAFIALEQLTLRFIPNEADFADGALHTIFEPMPRLCIASLASYYVSNTIDTYLYGWISKHTERIWVRNNASTLTSQLIDSVLFTIGAFAGLMEWSVVFELILTTYLLKVIIAVCDTPFIYWSLKVKPKNYE